MATSYSNYGGSGNRTSVITVTSDIIGANIPLSNWVNGTKGNELYFNQNGDVTGRYILFNFSQPVIIDEATLYSGGSMGTWKWQVSNDGVAFADVGSSFLLTGDANGSIKLTTLSSNTKSYKYYKLVGVSGYLNVSNFYNEMEFKTSVITNKYLFQDGSDIKKYVPGVNSKLSLNMTSENAPSPFIAEASTTNDYTSYPAWKAFDGVKNTPNTGWRPSSLYQAWLMIDLGIPKTISKYNLVATEWTNATLKGWKIQGSNNKTSWIDIDDRSGIATWAAYESRSYDVATPGSYRYYRLYVPDSTYVYSGDLRIGEWELFEITPPSWQTIGTAPATKAMFDTDGMTDLTLITNTAIQGLVSNAPEVLCWTDEVGASATQVLNAPTKTDTTNGQINAFTVNQANYYYSITSIQKG